MRTESYAVGTPLPSTTGAATAGSGRDAEPADLGLADGREARVGQGLGREAAEGTSSRRRRTSCAGRLGDDLDAGVSTAPAEVIGVTVTGVVVTAFVVPLRTATSGRRSSVVAAVLFSAALKCAVPPLLDRGEQARASGEGEVVVEGVGALVEAVGIGSRPTGIRDRGLPRDGVTVALGA